MPSFVKGMLLVFPARFLCLTEHMARTLLLLNRIARSPLIRLTDPLSSCNTISCSVQLMVLRFLRTLPHHHTNKTPHPVLSHYRSPFTSLLFHKRKKFTEVYRHQNKIRDNFSINSQNLAVSLLL